MKKLILSVALTLITALTAAAEVKKAPDFTLPDAEGNMVSLSSLQGNWVVLDFWGSWCGWCIKGFPQMKENYEELGSKVKFVGVAFGDKEQTWLNALKKYELPWINLWEDPEIDRRQSVATLYGVQGFPTKLIINPEGYIVNTTVGEDPEFYSILRALL